MYGRALSWSRYQWKARWNGRKKDQADHEEEEEEDEDEDDEDESSLVRCSSPWDRLDDDC